jgi:oligoribonuclease NrnB/cAMP/cGMP phosphodiesterase (DHH superfamily)
MAKVVNCNYNDIDDTIEDLIKDGSLDKADKIFITDITPSEKMMSKLDDLYKGKIKLYDHHSTAETLCSKFEWALCESKYYNKVSKEIYNISATEIFYIYEVKNNSDIDSLTLIEFVDYVSKWDTWRWENDKSSDDILNLQYLFKSFDDKTEFIDHIIHTYINPDDTMALYEKDLERIETIQMQDEWAYENAKNTLIIDYRKYGNRTYKVGIYVSSGNVSLTCSRLLKELDDQCNPIDFICAIDLKLNTLSFRTNKEYVDVSHIAIKYGGGGHKQSAGAQFDNAMKFYMYKIPFNEIEE